MNNVRYDEIFKELKQIISERLGIEENDIQINSQLRSEGLGIDSFSFVELLFVVKDKFGVEIKKDDIPKISTIKDVVEYIIDKNKEK